MKRLITIAFILLAAFIFIGVVFLSIISINNFQNRFNLLQSFHKNGLLGSNYTQLSRINLLKIQKYQNEVLLLEKKEDISLCLYNIEYYKKEFLINIKKTFHDYQSSQERKFLNQIKIQYSGYFEISEEINKLITTDKKKAVFLTISELNKSYINLDKTLNKLDQLEEEKALLDFSNSLLIIKICLIVISILFAFLLLLISIRHFEKKI